MKREREISLTNSVSLDPSTKTALSEFETEFYSIADILLNHAILDLNGKKYRLAEVEAYLKDDAHYDTFTHCDEQQLKPGEWYFHKVGKGYKGGSYKGLDVTFSKRGYSGMLIRAIMEVGTNKYIEGPSLVVDQILRETGASDIESLTKKDNFNWNVLEKSLCYLKVDEEKNLEQRPIVQSPRVGLVLRTDNHSKFLMKPYRFLTYPLLCKKGKQHLVLELYYLGKTKEEITKITGGTNASVTGYLQSYDASKAKPKKTSDYYAQKLKTDEFSKCFQVLRLEAAKAINNPEDKKEDVKNKENGKKEKSDSQSDD